MKIHVVNPNGSAEMTRSLEAEVQSAAGAAGCEVVVTYGGSGVPASIEGYADEAASLMPMLRNIRSQDRAGAAAHVIACFDDTGLDAAREVAEAPVIGICEAALATARIVSKRISIVTTLERSVPIVEELVHRYGAADLVRGVHGTAMPVLDLEGGRGDVMARLLPILGGVVTQDRADALVLGCAGMSQYTAALERGLGVRVIDGVRMSVHIAGALAAAQVKTSKSGAYAAPRSKAGAVFA
ncbi:aspartate/glutamate racemase family protein [Salipiger abyssi]|uniref:Allantoin racemase n=1 Tax=Salipiger abyssi TaxID=1250539 RepID=A0A1P8UW54_9RHOB|nr:aspartate/glutamate racemase family protein [Salipiger abyssi]APZ53622.1 allantoin racemase [Salipiger abyssi]